MPCGDNLPVAGNRLDRNFTARQANQAYVGDITYVRAREGRLHLAVVIGLSSRQVVGWPMAGLYPQGIYGLGLQMRASLVNGALLRAIWKRNPPKGLLRHNDRGSQYAATSHRKTTKRFGIRQSMGRKGNCWGACPLGAMRLREAFFTP